MTLGYASTDEDIWAAYDDNASYEEDASRTKATAFITACRILLRRRPLSASKEGGSINFETIREEMQAARAWLTANPDTSDTARNGARYANFENFRDV